MVFTLAEILRAKKFRQADDLCALLGRCADFLRGPANVLVRISGAVHLDQADGEGFRWQSVFLYFILQKNCHSDPELVEGRNLLFHSASVSSDQPAYPSPQPNPPKSD